MMTLIITCQLTLLGLGAGKTADIHQLVQLMKDKVLELYGQDLVEAFEYVGTWEREESLIEYE